MNNTNNSSTEPTLVETQAVPELMGNEQSRLTLSKPVMGIIGLVLILVLVLVNGGFSHRKQDKANSTSGKEIGNRLGDAPDISNDDGKNDKPNPDDSIDNDLLHTGLSSAPSNPQYASMNQRKQWTPEERKQLDDVLIVNRNSQLPSSAQMANSAQMNSTSINSANIPEQSNAFSTQLQATKLKGSVASKIIDPNLFITKGTFLDCILETAISSDVPGMTRCQLSRDIYSTNGNVLLLEKGSRIVGQYQGGLQQGQARIFVLWDRIETPNGIIIDLDSPGTDTLGRSGHNGFVDNHFKQRFGSAILLSLIGDAGNYAANKANSGDKNQIQFGDTIGSSKDLASIVLQDSIRIKSTLLKNQGEHINVFVARDLDFRSVYDLQLVD